MSAFVSLLRILVLISIVFQAIWLLAAFVSLSGAIIGIRILVLAATIALFRWLGRVKAGLQRGAAPTGQPSSD